MKRLLLVALLGFVLLPGLAHAQKKKRTAQLSLGLTYGAKGGLSFSKFANYKPNPGYNTLAFQSRAGLLLGGLVNYRMSQQLSIQVEALYSQRGTSYTSIAPRAKDANTGKVRLTYIDFPGLVKINQKIFYAEVGGVASYLISGKLQNSKGKNVGVAPANALDLSYAFGGGIELPQGYTLGVRYVRSAATIAKVGPLRNAVLIGGAGGEQDFENASFNITGGYIFSHVQQRGRRRR